MSRALRAASLALLTIVALAGCQREAKRPTLESSPAVEEELHRLLQERHQLLEGIAENAQRYVDAGRMTASEHTALKKAALLAKLDLCETRAERIEIREEIVSLDRKAEAWFERRAGSGRVGEGERDRARVRRIESEIELLRERRGQGNEYDER